ncbi:unannotated protein [freshwater metagenome]|uniref:Unannotated protein n=1 Tax=freshwater metagenome TaxID=449393 RepID=A0A6J7V6X8_9ZZZZ
MKNMASQARPGISKRYGVLGLLMPRTTLERLETAATNAIIPRQG